VIGNGDIFTPETAVKRLQESGCDGLMFARGAMGNPWLFSRTVAYFETGEIPPPPTQAQIIDTAIAHLHAVAVHPAGRIEEMRKHIQWYTKGMYGSANIRLRVNKASTVEEMEGLLRELL
jgi:tRNA-dihydrouridine synthase